MENDIKIAGKMRSATTEGILADAAEIQQKTGQTVEQAIKELDDKAATADSDIEGLNTAVSNINANTGISDYEEFSDQKEYKAGNTVLKDGLLKTFKVDHAVGAWDESEVEDGSLNKIVERKTRNILTETATTNKADIIEKAIIELKIFRNENTQAYINNFTGADISWSPKELNIRIENKEIGSVMSGYDFTYKKTNLYDDVWLYENDNLMAIVDFGLINGYVINQGASNNYGITGINRKCYILNRYYNSKLKELDNKIDDTKSDIEEQLDIEKGIYLDETFDNPWTVKDKAILASNGEETDYVGAFSTDYLSVSESAILTTQDKLPAIYDNTYGVAAYDEDKAFIQSWGGYPNTHPTIVLPSNTKYIRCSTIHIEDELIIRNNIYKGEKDVTITENKDSIESINSILDSNGLKIGSPVKVVDAYKANYRISAAEINSEPSYQYYEWSNTFKIEVNENEVIWLFNLLLTFGFEWITLNSEGKVVRKGEHNAYGFTRKIIIQKDEKYLVWNQRDANNINAKGTYLIDKNNKYLLNGGTTENIDIDKIVSENSDLEYITKTNSKVGDICLLETKLQNESVLKIPIENNDAFFVGLWLYVPVSIQKNIENITINNAIKKVISFSACDLQFCNKYIDTNGGQRYVEIKVQLKEGITETKFIFGGCIYNHITIPTVIYNFDSTYAYSEDEKVYDWILKEKEIPITVTGSFNTASDGATITDWQYYINNGQVDLGTYGGEISLHPTNWEDYGSVNALINDPYGEKCPDISNILTKISTNISDKIDNYGCAPLSFGGQQYYVVKKAVYALLQKGYKITRLPTSSGSQEGISFGTLYANNRLIYGDSAYGINKINGVTKNCGVYVEFNHGLSDKHNDGGTYLSFSGFKNNVGKIISLRNEGSIKFMNMSQYYKEVVDNGLIETANI